MQQQCETSSNWIRDLEDLEPHATRVRLEEVEQDRGFRTDILKSSKLMNGMVIEMKFILKFLKF